MSKAAISKDIVEMAGCADAGVRVHGRRYSTGPFNP